MKVQFQEKYSKVFSVMKISTSTSRNLGFLNNQIKNNNKEANIKSVSNVFNFSSSLLLKDSRYLLYLNKGQKSSNCPNFKKVVDTYDKQQCKKIVNQSAATCAGIAGAVGKASAFGIDPWLQRGVQSAMFLYLADYLEVPAAAAAYYAGVEFYSGARFGIEAGKIITSAGALAIDAATGGSSIAITEAATRGGNSLLSFYLTRRMGNGFIKQVETNNMTAGKQLLRAGQYGMKKAVMGGFHAGESISDFDTILDIDEYKELLDKLPDSDKSLIGEIYDKFFQAGIARAPSVFLANLMPSLIFNGLKGEKNDKNLFKNALKDTLMTTVIYDLCNIGVDEQITAYAAKKYDDLSRTLFENPEVYEDFNETLEKVARKIRADNIEKMDSKEFLKQFKNKEFVFELSRSIDMEVKSFTKKLKEKKRGEFEAEKNNLLDKSAGFISKINETAIIEGTPERKKINEKIKAFLTKSSENKKTNDFGFNTIAGYDSEKIKLDNAIGTLLQMDDVEAFELPNVILIYGPRGVGKTSMSKAAACEYGCRCIKKTFVGDKSDILSKIEKIANDAKKQYETADIPRHTILIMDECTSFITNPETEEDNTALKKFNDFIKNCSQKYHMTIFMTTNYPQLIEPQILNNNAIALKMPVKNANKQNITDILKHYAPSADNDNIDYNIITEKIINKAGLNAYSNSQIETIGRCLPIKGELNATNSQEKMLELLEQIKPEISAEDIDKITSIEKGIGT